MRRCGHFAIFALLAPTLLGLAACSSDSAPSGTGADSAAPDGSFCSLLIAFRTSNDSLDAEVNSGDTARAKAAVTRLVSQADLLRRKAPAEIKIDVDNVSVYVTNLDRLFAEYGYDIDSFVGDEVASAKFLALTDDAVDSSLLQLRTYAETECVASGAVVSDTSVASSTTTPGTS